jgi:hypothetical protein
MTRYHPSDNTANFGSAVQYSLAGNFSSPDRPNLAKAVGLQIIHEQMGKSSPRESKKSMKVLENPKKSYKMHSFCEKPVQ